jgi:hypothetical protein
VAGLAGGKLALSFSEPDVFGAMQVHTAAASEGDVAADTWVYLTWILSCTAPHSTDVTFLIDGVKQGDTVTLPEQWIDS